MKNILAPLILLASIAMARAQVQSYSLTWDPSTSTNVVAYRVYESDGTNTVIQSVQAAIPPATNWMTFSNLVAGRTYTFYATAINDVGLESDPSNTNVWSTVLQLPQFNAKRTAATLINGLWTIPVSWNSVSSLASYGISNYWVNIVGTDSTNNIPIATSSFTVRGLPVGNYTISISATNSISASPAGLVLMMSNVKPISPLKLTPKIP